MGEARFDEWSWKGEENSRPHTNLLTRDQAFKQGTISKKFFLH